LQAQARQQEDVGFAAFLGALALFVAMGAYLAGSKTLWQK
jgi:hypothetical protein